MEERKKWEGLSNEIHQIKKQLGFYIAFNKTWQREGFRFGKGNIKILWRKT